MNMRAVTTLRSVAVGLAALAFAAAASAAIWTSSAKFGQFSTGGYTIYNDVWGAGAGPQTIWANSATNWGITTQQPNGGGVKSYPNSAKNINKSISNYNGSGSWNYSVPSGTFWDCSFDIWVPTEVMIWLGRSSGVGPRGSLQTSNVSIGGHTWNVYRENSSFNVVSFVRTSNSFSGSVNLRTMLDYARLTRGWIGNGTIGGLGLGFEVFGTGNVSKNYTMNSMSIGN
jgi:hypothetical protein